MKQQYDPFRAETLYSLIVQYKTELELKINLIDADYKNFAYKDHLVFTDNRWEFNYILAQQLVQKLLLRKSNFFPKTRSVVNQQLSLEEIFKYILIHAVQKERSDLVTFFGEINQFFKSVKLPNLKFIIVSPQVDLKNLLSELLYQLNSSGIPKKTKIMRLRIT